MPILSIVIPLYNATKYVQKTVETIEAKSGLTNDELEILLIDDGSPDDTQEVCHSIIAEYKNVKYYKKENGGVASSRDFGLSKATGKYIAFFDQDDDLYDGYTDFIDKLEETNVDFIMTDYYTRKDGKLKTVHNIKENGIVYKDELMRIVRYMLMPKQLADDEKPKVMPHTSIWECVFRRQFIIDKGLHFFSFVDCEDDRLFVLQSLLNADSAYFTHRQYYIWNIISTSESHTNKYLNDWYKNKRLLDDWILSALKKTGVSKKDIDLFNKDARTKRILFGFINASEMPITKHFEMDFGNELDEIIDNEKSSEEYFPMHGCLKHRLEYKILYKLLLSRKYKMAYWLNKNIFHRWY